MRLIPHDGMRITADTSLAGGVYHLPGGLVIDADGVTLDGGGALVPGSGAGVAVENGIACTVRDNDFLAGAYGLLLWSKYVEPFVRTHPANDTSRDWLISSNRFSGNRVAVRIAADQDHGVRPLPPSTPRCLRPQRHTLRANHFRDNQLDIELIDVEEPQLEANRFAAAEG